MKTILGIMLASLVMVTNQVYAQALERSHGPHEHGVNEREHSQDQGPRAGHLSPEERKELHQDVNDLSKDIYREKPNTQKHPRARTQ